MLAAALLGAIIAALALLPVGTLVADLLDAVAALGWWGPVALALVYVPAALLALPGSVLTLGAGFLFGVPLGTAIVSLGSTAGACAAFATSRALGASAIARRIERYPRFRAVTHALEARGLPVVLLLRLTPLVPYNIANYALGLTRVRFRDFLLGSWLGMLPGTLLYVYLGSALTELSQVLAGDLEQSPAQATLFWGGLAATLIATLVIGRIAAKALHTKETS